MLDLNEIKQDHEIATEPVWWGRADRGEATMRLLKRIPTLIEELREARAEIERLRALMGWQPSNGHSWPGALEEVQADGRT